MLKFSYAYLASIEILLFVAVIYALINVAQGDTNFFIFSGSLLLAATINAGLLIDIIHNISKIIEESLNEN